MEIKELIRFVKQYRKLIDRASYVSIDCYNSVVPSTPIVPVGHWDDGDKADAILDVLTDCAREDVFRLKRDGVAVLYFIHFDL